MRTVYLGTSDFAATVLRRLAGSPHRPALVVTPPDSKQGRGRKLRPPPVAEAAGELGIDLVQAEDVNGDSALEAIRAARPEVVAVCAFGQLIREPLLSEWPMLNVHPSLLPRWRGAAPVERSLMAGDEETGVSVIELVEELDAGPIAAQSRFPIGPDDDAGAVFGHARGLTPDLVEAAMANRQPAAQGDEGVTYAEKITPADRDLDWSRPPQELHNSIRALSPHIGARGVVEGRPVIVWRSHLVDGSLELLEVQPEGRRRMTYDEFLRGLRR